MYHVRIEQAFEGAERHMPLHILSKVASPHLAYTRTCMNRSKDCTPCFTFLSTLFCHIPFEGLDKIDRTTPCMLHRYTELSRVREIRGFLKCFYSKQCIGMCQQRVSTSRPSGLCMMHCFDCTYIILSRVI